MKVLLLISSPILEFLTVPSAEIRGLEAAENGNAIRVLVRNAVDSHFGYQHTSRRHVAVVVLDAKGDLQLPGIIGSSAMSDGLGIVGSRGFYALPTTLEGVTGTVI